jgi:hypothetical protein
MFSTWKQEKATASLVDEAQALADKLESAKPHHLDAHAAAAQYWAAFYLSTGVNLADLVDWKPATVTRFASAAQTRIAALRKQRFYDSSDGLAIWMHTARAVTEPRIAPAVRDIWRHLSRASSNADVMAADLLQEAGLALEPRRAVPKGFEAEE